jgi:hypothetical protein
VEFDFKTTRLSFGKVSKDESVTKKAVLQILNPKETKIVGIETSSPFIRAEQGPVSSEEGYEEGVEIEVTLEPGLPPGKIHETVTVSSNLASKPEAKLYLAGLIVGDVEVTPDMLRFMYKESQGAEKQILQHKLQIRNRSAEKTLKILKVQDPKNMLELALATIEEGRQYELTATLKNEALSVKGDTAGQLIITTNDPEQSEITVSYRVMRRK